MNLMILEMGNKLCSAGKGVAKPPRDLTSFLKASLETDKENNNSWLAEFRKFLANNNQTDVLNCLEFVLEVEELKGMTREETENPSRKRLEEIRSTKLSKLRNLGTTFFSVQSDKCIPLSNQVLLEETGSTLRGLGPNGVDEAMRMVEAATKDNRVWKSGLESTYRNFVATNPDPTVRAVLLSIL